MGERHHALAASTGLLRGQTPQDTAQDVGPVWGTVASGCRVSFPRSYRATNMRAGPLSPTCAVHLERVQPGRVVLSCSTLLVFIHGHGPLTRAPTLQHFHNTFEYKQTNCGQYADRREGPDIQSHPHGSRPQSTYYGRNHGF